MDKDLKLREAAKKHVKRYNEESEWIMSIEDHFIAGAKWQSKHLTPQSSDAVEFAEWVEENVYYKSVVNGKWTVNEKNYYTTTELYQLFNPKTTEG